MTRLLQLGSIGFGSRRRPRSQQWRRSIGLRPWLEGLEDRTVLSTITWNTTLHPTGGSWDDPSSWNGDVVPGVSDIAEIEGLTGSGTVFLDSDKADSVQRLSTDSTTTLEVINGSLSLEATSSSTLGGSVLVSQGASLSVGAGASVQIGAGPDDHRAADRSASLRSDTVTFNGGARRSMSIPAVL